MTGAVGKPGCYEAPNGITTRELVEEHAGGFVGEVGAVVPGGAASGILPPAALDAPLTRDGLREYGAGPGSAAVQVFPASYSPLRLLAETMRFFAEESCQKCTPCRIGNRALHHLAEELQHGEAAMTREKVDEWLLAMEKTSICGLGQASPFPVRERDAALAGAVRPARRRRRMSDDLATPRRGIPRHPGHPRRRRARYPGSPRRRRAHVRRPRAGERSRPSRRLYRLLRALASLGVLHEADGRRFSLTPLGQPLRGDVPGSLRGWARLIGRDHVWRSWGNLANAVRNGENSFRALYGADVFEWRAEHPEESAIFDEAMKSLTSTSNDAVLAAYDFGRFGTIVDVGGGNGTLLASRARGASRDARDPVRPGARRRRGRPGRCAPRACSTAARSSPAASSRPSPKVATRTS